MELDSFLLVAAWLKTLQHTRGAVRSHLYKHDKYYYYYYYYCLLYPYDADDDLTFLTSVVRRHHKQKTSS